MEFRKHIIARYSSILVLLTSFFIISLLAEHIQTRLYLNMIVTILLFAVIPSSFCYLHACEAEGANL